MLARYLSIGLLLTLPCRAESSGTVEQRVIGGSPADEADFPAVGALLHVGDTSATFECTGTLIAPRLVLTAAHCLGRTSDLAFVRESDPLSASEQLPVVGARIHPRFAISGEQVVHDIGVVELGRAVAGVAPVALPDSAPRRDEPVTLVGYGAMRVDEASGQRDPARVKNAAVSSVTDVSDLDLVIGRDGMPENCTGDSGGPALEAGPDGVFRVVGVVSRALFAETPCVGGSVHTRVDAHLEFIDAVDGLAGDPGGCNLSSRGRHLPMNPLAPFFVGCSVVVASRRRTRPTGCHP